MNLLPLPIFSLHVRKFRGLNFSRWSCFGPSESRSVSWDLEPK